MHPHATLDEVGASQQHIFWQCVHVCVGFLLLIAVKQLARSGPAGTLIATLVEDESSDHANAWSDSGDPAGEYSAHHLPLICSGGAFLKCKMVDEAGPSCASAAHVPMYHHDCEGLR